MKAIASLRLLVLVMALVLLSAACILAFGQSSEVSLPAAPSPAITSFTVADRETTCAYTVGISTTPCAIGPGMFLIITGSNFGAAAGGVSLCDCPFFSLRRWSPVEISGIVDSVAPGSSLALELPGGGWSNAIPYTALAPVITRIDVGTCSYVPNQSRHQFVVVPGTQITIHGRYFGPGTGQVATCDCANATIESWDPDWTAKPSPANNIVVVTAVQAICGSMIGLQANTMWSNLVPYTTCGSN